MILYFLLIKKNSSTLWVGVPMKCHPICHSRENGKGDLNNKFRFLIFRSKHVPNLIGYGTSARLPDVAGNTPMPARLLEGLCLGDSWF